MPIGFDPVVGNPAGSEGLPEGGGGTLGVPLLHERLEHAESPLQGVGVEPGSGGPENAAEAGALHRLIQVEELLVELLARPDRNNPGQGYCRAVVAPKVAKFRQRFLHKLKGATQPAP